MLTEDPVIEVFLTGLTPDLRRENRLVDGRSAPGSKFPARLSLESGIAAVNPNSRTTQEWTETP